MRASKDDLPIMLQAGTATVRAVDWGDLRVALVSVPAGTDFAPLLHGLPDNLCPAPHWGYIVKGRLRIEYKGGLAETLAEGDLYYMPPGHTGIALDDLEFVEIVPPAGHQQFVDNARANLAGASAP
jgi:hypothetical protein